LHVIVIMNEMETEGAVVAVGSTVALLSPQRGGTGASALSAEIKT
jgi:hypothetical protein